VTAIIGSIGEPVPVLGWSSGGMITLGAAALTDAVSSVIAYEPPVFEAIDEQMLHDFTDTVTRMRAELDQGRPADAAQRFMTLIYNDDELETAHAQGLADIAASNIPADLGLLEHLHPTTRPSLTDPALLTTIAVPVLLLQGTRTKPWFNQSNHHVAEHVPDAEIRLIPGAGHGGPLLQPEPIARQLARFLHHRPCVRRRGGGHGTSPSAGPRGRDAASGWPGR
jgi:pimeloyl-ACP methyl ester carboxylesterase